jgi:hypothetical protein
MLEAIPRVRSENWNEGRKTHRVYLEADDEIPCALLLHSNVHHFVQLLFLRVLRVRYEGSRRIWIEESTTADRLLYLSGLVKASETSKETETELMELGLALVDNIRERTSGDK